MSSAADTWPYSAREAAALLGVSERTIRRAIARGDLAAMKHAGVFRITPDALTDYGHQRRYASSLRLVSGRSRSDSLPETSSAPQLLRLVNQTDDLAFDLPRPLTPFLGRDREIAAVIAMLSRPEIRLLSLTGPGGVGKTRLALQVAQELPPRFVDGVAFVPLASVLDAALVPSIIAQALGVREHGDRPIGERVATVLRDRRLLLVIDNFEHVLSAATFAVDLLATCPALTILVTSRTMLGVSGEHRFPVPPMTLPDPATTMTPVTSCQVDAVQLFVARAQAAEPGFALTDENADEIAEICHRLDGLPLAIELAAARIPVLPPRALLARLESRLPMLTGGPRDAPVRLQTMRDAIAWSYDLLSPAQQVLFCRLAVFAGGCTLEGAAAIADPDMDTLTGISFLVASSLLQQENPPSGEPRYVMLETIREFGLEQLMQAGEEAKTRQRHASYCLALSERGYPNHFGPFTGIDQRHQQLEEEQPNVRAALAFLASVGDAEGVLRLTGALGLFWQQRGHLREGRYWLEWALDNTVEAQTDARCRALVCLGSLRGHQGEHERAIPLLRSALAIAEAIDVPEKAAHAIHVLGFIAAWQRRWEEAEALFTDVLARWRALDAWGEEAVALQHLSGIAIGRGDTNLATRHAEASLQRSRAVGYASGAGLALCRLGWLARDRGDDRHAALAYHEALGLWASENDHWYISLALAGLADIASAHGRAPAAASLLGAIDTLAEEAGALPPSARINRDRAGVVARAALGQERCDELRAAGRRLRLGEAVVIAAAIPVPHAVAGGPLTARESEVLRLIAAGRTDQEIADTLFLSRRTVNAHVAHILTKLEVHTRHEATCRARELGLLPSGEPERYT